MKKVFSCFIVLILFGCAETAYKIAQEQDTYNAYEQFLSAYPHSEYSDKARQRIAEIAFHEAQKKNTVQAYKEFLKQYPESGPASSAEKKLETYAYEKAQKNNTMTAYKKFLKQHPKGDLAPKAEEKLEDFAYVKTKKEDTIEAYKQFLSQYPQGLNATNAIKIKNAKESGLWLTASHQKLSELSVIWIDGWEKGVRIISIDGKVMDFQKTRWVYLEPGTHTILASYNYKSLADESISLKNVKSDSNKSDIEYWSSEITIQARVKSGFVYIIKHTRQKSDEEINSGKKENALKSGGKINPFIVQIGSVYGFNDFVEIQGKKYLPEEWEDLKESNRSRGKIILFKEDLID